jgi:transposase-like protein
VATSRAVTRPTRQAAAKVTGDEEELLAFYDYPAEHWVHLRTTNPIESLNARYRRAVKARGHFPTEQAARTYAKHQDHVQAAGRTGPQQAVQQVTKRNWSVSSTRTFNRRYAADPPLAVGCPGHAGLLEE